MARSRNDPGKASRTGAPASAEPSQPRDATPEDYADAELVVSPTVAVATPSMAQYLEIKAANPDSLLWYRMGDFYELFFEDAVTAAEALSITLTKRGKHLGQDIPMCGVPVVRADDYLQRLIRKGFRVAVCEQLEDPTEARKRGSKAVVRRDVVRLVTPGTLTEDSLLDARARNYLTAVFSPAASGHTRESQWALASLELSTGEFEVGLTTGADLAGEFARLAPGEILLPDRLGVDRAFLELARAHCTALTPLAAPFYDGASGERLLAERLGVRELGGFGSFSRPELAAVGALLKYVDITQIGARPVLRPPRRIGGGHALLIDAATRASLELLRSTRGEREGSLLAAMDRTLTGGGARELAARLASPLGDATLIRARLDAVQHLVEHAILRADVRTELRQAPDVARALQRLSLDRGGPRDLATVRDAANVADTCARLLAKGGHEGHLPEDLAKLSMRLAAVDAGLVSELTAALVDLPPLNRRDGGFVRQGFRAELDEARALSEDSRRIMAALEARYVTETGVRTLKVRHNNILGFFIEVGAQNARPLMSPPLDQSFRHRQTMANAVRFTTDELVAIEGRISTSAERALAIEQEIHDELKRAVLQSSAVLLDLASALAELDVIAALAELAETEAYTRPEIDPGTELSIRGGRHPVVEQALRADKAARFVENDCILGSDGDIGRPTGLDETARGRIWLVTGPNMAGKSTFLRQVALITVMAQMGSFVPAREARIGIVDRLFSRVGAADDLARGRSTFMVEMVETAAILNQAGPRSLVVLDEIGRGTATYDGLSIAWATVEHLHDVCRCRTLFATHYHEMTALAARLGEVVNATIEVKEWNDEIVFLHKVRAGAADRSYGIQVAKLAGLPRQVIARASEVLALLESNGRRPAAEALGVDELPLFAARRSEPDPPHPKSALAVAIEGINPDDLTPRAALEELYRLKSLADKEKSRG